MMTKINTKGITTTMMTKMMTTSMNMNMNMNMNTRGITITITTITTMKAARWKNTASARLSITAANPST